MIVFYQEIMSACDMLAQEAKVNRKPRKTKVVSKDKIVAKLKFLKTNEPLKLVSINPTDIIGASELWIFNTKTRKLGKYVANEFNTLNVKGTTITNFNEFTSIQKTVRKPEEKLKEFKAAGKVQLRKFLDDINATDTKLNGRINEDTISYNLKTVLDGTENKVEDVIKRLPGLDIDQDGKVLYKGQQIDNVLVDGNEFFGKKHQMATQNINADMIEGIDLLTNYSGFAKASGGQKSIALNLKTKDSYKNKWITDIELAAGLNTSFRFHSNSFLIA